MTIHEHSHPDVERDERRLAALWPRVRRRLPPPPARVLEIGCGPIGGFVPRLVDDGYEALGIDPEAPEGPPFRRIEFERAELYDRVDAVVACTSLHHVLDPADTIERIADVLQPGGALVVVEWDWERLDEPTVRWCLERLDPRSEGWLGRLRYEWAASGKEWDVVLREWAREGRLHDATTLLRLLDERFERQNLAEGPYFFTDLLATTEADEQAAIDAGAIRATRIEYVGRVTPS